LRFGKNLSSFGFSGLGFLRKKKPNVLKCAAAFALLLTPSAMSSNGFNNYSFHAWYNLY